MKFVKSGRMRDGKDERVRGTAAQALLDRGWGKAKVEVVTGAEGSYLDVLRAVNEQLQLKRSNDWPENRIFAGFGSGFWLHLSLFEYHYSVDIVSTYIESRKINLVHLYDNIIFNLI